MSRRISCLCLGCKRTVKAASVHPFNEWICHRHWQAVPKQDRRIYARAKRQNRDPRALDRLWRRLSRTAIQNALLYPA